MESGVGTGASPRSLAGKRRPKRPPVSQEGPEGGTPDAAQADESLNKKEWVSPFLSDEGTDLATVLIVALKFADLGHVVKPLALHEK